MFSQSLCCDIFQLGNHSRALLLGDSISSGSVKTKENKLQRNTLFLLLVKRLQEKTFIDQKGKKRNNLSN